MSGLPFESYQFEVYRQVLEDLRADGFIGLGLADIAAEHQRMQAGHAPGATVERHLWELLRRHLSSPEDRDSLDDRNGQNDSDGSSEAVGS